MTQRAWLPSGGNVVDDDDPAAHRLAALPRTTLGGLHKVSDPSSYAHGTSHLCGPHRTLSPRTTRSGSFPTSCLTPYGPHKEFDHLRFTRGICSAEDDPPDSCYTEIIKYVAHVARRARRRVMRTVHRSAFVRRFEAALGLRHKHDPNVDVEAIDRRASRHRRSRRHNQHHQTGEDVDNEDNADAAAAAHESPRPSSSPDPSKDFGSPRAPRASPEPSDVDPMSSPRWPRSSLATTPGSAGVSPPLDVSSSGANVVRCSSASAGLTSLEQQDTAAVTDRDYYNLPRFTHADAKKGIQCAFKLRIMFVFKTSIACRVLCSHMRYKRQK